jgi:WD40 repeat protein
MPLRPGTRIGTYEVTGSLGAGGMGEVYRAHDTRLGRDVALKILPASFAADPDRRARFEREARALAALNHPNIAHIYAVEDVAGTPGLAMELVDGPTLAELLERAHTEPEQANTLPIARQLVEALDAAHEAGIIHRDLKPANIKVRDDGTVKILDFGLAKALLPDSGIGVPDSVNSPTLTSPAMTEAGLILGTAAYMSPEQARGRAVDKRADIWAFGVVLFEMVSARRLFHGDTVSDTLAAVLREDIPWQALPATTPAPVRRLLASCLERDPRKRLRDIGDARAFLDPSAAAVDAPTGITQPIASPRPGITRGVLLLWAASLMVVGAIGGWLGWRMTPATPAPVRQFTIQTESGAPAVRAAVSPSGRLLAYTTTQRAFIRPLAQTAAREIPGSDGVTALTWSPDSEWIAFQARGQLWKVAASGTSAPVAIARVAQDFTAVGAAAWLPDNRIVYSSGASRQLHEVSADGGTPKSILDLDPNTERDIHDVSSLPDGTVLFVVDPLAPGRYSLELFRDGQRKRISMQDAQVVAPVYSPTGHLLFHKEGALWAAPFSLSALDVTGEPFLVQPDVVRPSVASDGTMVTVPGHRETPAELVWVDRQGKISEPISPMRQGLRGIRLSADGKRVVATAGAAGSTDIYVYDAARLAERRLTYEPDADNAPVLSADGALVTYVCGEQLCQRRVDGTGERTVVVKENVRAASGSPDGKHIVIMRSGATSMFDLYALPTSTDGRVSTGATPEPFLVLDRAQRSADVSPNGQLAAYETNEGGSFEVFATRFPKAEGKWRVSDGMGLWPRWSAKGDKIFYVDDQARIVEVNVTLSPSFEVSTPRVVIDTTAFGADALRDGFERSLDGQRFLVARSRQADKLKSSMFVIENWLEWYREKK